MLYGCSFFELIQKPVPSGPPEPVTEVPEPSETDSVLIVQVVDSSLLSDPDTIFGIPQFEFKDRYSISVALPFLINQEQINGISQSQDTALSFYEGAQIALDSLQNSGFQANIKYVDHANEESKVDSFLENNIRIGTDLCVWYHNGQYSALVKTGSDSESTNYYYQVKPDMHAHLNSVHAYAKEYFKESKMLVVHREDISFEEDIADQFFNSMMPNADSTTTANHRLALPESKLDTNDIIKLLDPEKVNIVYMAVTDEGTVFKFMRDLRRQCDTYTIRIIGLPNWVRFRTLDLEYLDKYQIVITSSASIDYHDENSGKLFRAKYGLEYESEPHDAAYLGFDILYYFGDKLRNYGLSSQFSIDSTTEMLHNQFSWKIDSIQSFDADPKAIILRNNATNILEFKNFIFEKVYRLSDQ